MSTKIDYLHDVEIFQDLTHAEVENVGAQATMARYQAGHLFYMPDDPGEVLFILKAGHVALYQISQDGRKLVVGTLSPGAIFGHMALVGQRLHNTFAEAVDDCVICMMNRREVETLLVEKPQVALRFLNVLGERLLDAERRAEEMTFKRIPARLAGLLIRLNAENGGEGVLKGYTHQSLAEMVGTYRETTTHTLNEFQSQDLIELGRKSIKILDVTGLATIAEA